MRKALLIVGWGVTLAAAFFFGRGSTPEVGENLEVTAKSTATLVPAELQARVEAAEARARAAEDALATRKNAETAADLLPSAPAPVIVATATSRGAATVSDASSVIRIKDAVERARAFAYLRDGMNSQNAQQIMAAFLSKGFESTREQEEIRMLAETWASIDGKGALDYLSGLDHDDRPENTLRSSLAEWATKDLDAAEAWARAATTNQPNHYMIGVIAGAANVDLARAERLLYEMPYGRTRGDAMAYVAGAHLANGNADAMDWATRVPDPRLAMASIRKVAAQVALTDPAMAANWVVKNTNEEQMRYNVSEIARQWSYISAVDAANWAMALPAGAAQESAVMSTLPALAKSQPAAAEKLLLNYPPSKATDAARLQLAKNYSDADPIRALAWANTVADKGARSHYTQRIVESWTKRDPAGAAAFLQTKVQ